MVGGAPLLNLAQAGRRSGPPSTVGVWGETFATRPLQANRILAAPTGNADKPGFPSLQEAAAWAGVLVARDGLDGAAIVETDDRFVAIGIDVESFVGRDFTRAHVEGGFDTLSIEGGETSKVRGFVTKDGYLAPVTRQSQDPSVAVYIVEPSRAGGYWHASKLPPPDAFRSVIQARRSGADLRLNPEASVALFRTIVKTVAIAQLDRNVAQMDAVHRALSRTVNEPQSPIWQLALKSIAADRALAKQHRQLSHEIRAVRLQDLHRAEMMLPGDFAALKESLQPLEARLTAVETARLELRRGNPALAVLNVNDIDPRMPRQHILRAFEDKMVDVRRQIEVARIAIHTDDMSIEQLAPVVQSVSAVLGIDEAHTQDGDTMSVAVQAWLRNQAFKDRVISLGGGGLSLGLGVAALLTTGGLAVVLGLSGSAVGFATAAYDFERSDDLYSAAEAGKGGHDIVANPNDAAFHRTMALVNLVLGGADLTIALQAASKIAQGASAFDALSDVTSAERAAEIAEGYGKAKATLDDILLDTTGHGAAKYDLRIIPPPATHAAVDLRRMTDKQLTTLLSTRFPSARLQRLQATAPRIAGEGARAPEFYRTISKAELQELLSTRLIQPPGMTGRAADLLNAKQLKALPDQLARNLKISLQDAKKLAAMEPGVARSRWLLDNVDHQVLADAHQQHASWFSFMSPFKSVSMGPHYAPKPGDFALRVFDVDGRVVKTVGGEYEGEWLFTGTMRFEEVGEVLTPQQFGQRFPDGILDDISRQRETLSGPAQ